MKIAFVSKIRLPENRGVSFAVVNMCQALTHIGHDIQLILPDRPPKRGYETINFWHYYELKENTFPVKRLFCLNVPFVPFLEFFLVHFREIVMSWSFSLNLTRYLVRERFPVVHLFGECREALLLLKLISWVYRPVVIYEIHIPPIGWYEGLLERASVSRVDVLVTSNKYLARFYKRKYLFKGKVVVGPNGVNLGQFDFRTTKAELRKKLRLPTRKIIVGFGGRFVTDQMEKGVPELVRAMVILKKKYRRVFLVCVGGPIEFVKKYRKLAHKLHFGKQDVVFLDHVAPQKLYCYMRAFDICVMPFPLNYHFAHVMAPLKMFEYMASKNPIVATNLPSVREVLTNEKTALLAKPGDKKDLAKTIGLLIRDRNLGRHLARQAYDLVSSRYTWQRRQARIIAASRQLIYRSVPTL